MIFDEQEQSPLMDAEVVLTAVLKLLGIYLLYTAVLQSGFMLSGLYSLAAQLSSPGGIISDWGSVAADIAGSLMAAGLGVVLVRHGSRAAHWLAIRSDLRVPVADPTRNWFRGSIALIGVWVLTTHLFAIESSTVWFVISALDSSSGLDTPYGQIYAIVSVLHAGALLVVGSILIFRAQRIGDWLYRVSGAAKLDEQSV